ncbi:S-layer homology domain-containing protein [Paenisporosarcina quisquiliarum]|uniref:S-layer homology domain-containing protein n=1 Tax=Paenisporosarcina quisquiliarum TaxID=365346 RepID=A0A9X3LEQ2_9BACL|nr:S-layer homology domain-containing protein [Paenisporosarcina quisquiliarum]MCZ8536645.1 S-layer homology domain-containing protein [Paenisporosarcina quisquiliarum]
MKHIKKGSLLVVVFTLAFTMLLKTQTAQADNHDDITGTLETEMREAVKRGILLGYGDGKYGQEEHVTRAQFAAFIQRALSLPEAQSNFKDVTPNMTLAASVNAVAGAGIMQGVSTEFFNPDALITREQVAMTIENALVYSKMELVKKEILFSDAGLMTSGTKLAIFHAINYGIVNGMPNDNGTMRFEPKSNATRAQAAAFIIRFLTAKENYVPPVVNPVPVPEPTPIPTPIPEPEPPIDTTKYYNATLKDGQLVKGLSEYTTYVAANSAFRNNPSAKAIYKGNEMIQIKEGLAYAKHYTPGSATVIYSDSTFSRQVSYIQYGRELKLLESNDRYVKVQAGGTIGFAKQSEIEYIPQELITNKDYYMPSSTGVLIHFTYNHANKSFGFGGYQIGPAPTFMMNLQKYFSQDGVNFYHENGTFAGQHYPYFQYLSARTKTNYTAEELDLYISDRLQTVSTKYPTALTTSKLIGLGAFLKEVESIYNVNALFILSAAMHESDSGMSVNAQTKNNLFGIKVFDSTPQDGETYTKPEDSVVAFVTRYVNLNYGPPTGLYAKGLAPGNKTSGMNVHYASDPNWGAKIAQYMWRGDALLGYKDSGVNAKQLAMTAHNGVINVRSTPEVRSDNLLFTYKAKDLGVNISFGYPLVILEETIGTDGYTWFKVLSDQNPPADFGWIREKDANFTLVRKIK